MTVEVYTFCWNEMAVLPWAVDYWRRYAQKVTVFDNGSTDGSVEFMKKHRDLIDVVPYSTPGMDNDIVRNMKNDCWRQAKGRADLVVVCDLDEMLIPMRDSLWRMCLSGATICRPVWYDLVSYEVPCHQEGIDKMYLHEQRPLAIYHPEGPKAVLFNPNKIENINYTPGAHQCKPEGEVKWYGGGDMYLLHVNHNFSLEYKVKRYEQLHQRRSRNDLNKSYGIHYQMTPKQIADQMAADRKGAINLCQVIGWNKTTEQR